MYCIALCFDGCDMQEMLWCCMILLLSCGSWCVVVDVVVFLLWEVMFQFVVSDIINC